jgi:uncharacterized protein YbaP (TraB family)
MKKFIAVLLAVLLTATPAFALSQTVDGEEFIQVRAAAEARGWEVDWDREDRAVILTSPHGEGFFILVDESGSFIENGRVYSPADLMELLFFLGASPQIIDGVSIHGKLTRIAYGDNVAYIFGTMHAAQPGWFPLHPLAEDAMARSDVFAFEFDLSEMFVMDDELLAQIEAIQLLPDGLTLEDILPEDVFENFIENLATYAVLGLTYDLVQNLTPIALLSALESVMVSLLGVDVELSVDNYIFDFAETNNREIIGLNTMLGELEIVFDIPLEIQATALENFPTFEQMLEAVSDMGLIEAYATQDILAIRQMFTIPEGEALSEYEELFYHNLLYVRCNIFADEIARLLRETEEPTTFFVAIGMGHIIGGCCNSGGGIVLYLLSNMGFELEELWNQ